MLGHAINVIFSQTMSIHLNTYHIKTNVQQSGEIWPCNAYLTHSVRYTQSIFFLLLLLFGECFDCLAFLLALKNGGIEGESISLTFWCFYYLIFYGVKFQCFIANKFLSTLSKRLENKNQWKYELYHLRGSWPILTSG